jgi:hypothetical protein
MEELRKRKRPLSGILTSFDKCKEEPRHYASLTNTCGDFNHQHKEFQSSTQGILWAFFWNCPQHCKQDLPKKVGVAAHAVISKKIG